MIALNRALSALIPCFGCYDIDQSGSVSPIVIRNSAIFTKHSQFTYFEFTIIDPVVFFMAQLIRVYSLFSLHISKQVHNYQTKMLSHCLAE